MERDKLSVKIHDNKYEINYTNNLKTLQKKLLPIIKKEYKGIETISFDNLYLLYKDKDEDLISIADDNDATVRMLRYNRYPFSYSRVIITGNTGCYSV